MSRLKGAARTGLGEPASSAAEPEPSRVDTLFSGGNSSAPWKKALEGGRFSSGCWTGKDQRFRRRQRFPEPQPRTGSRWRELRRWEGGKKERKPNKPRICQLCGQPRQNDYGHSQFGGEHFCALHSGITVELWLAEKRRT